MKLPSDFKLTKYGLTVRLVDESDVSFIFELRSDSELDTFLNKIPNDINVQRDWIREYKKREREGIEYYFVYLVDSTPIGVYRMANVKNDSWMGASLIFRKDCPPGSPILAMLIHFFIGFEILGKSVSFGDVMKGNTRTIKLNQFMGFDFIHEDEKVYYTLLSKKIYYDTKSKVEKLFKVKD